METLFICGLLACAIIVLWYASNLSDARIRDNQRQIDQIALEIVAINKFINEMATPSAITPVWEFTHGQPPEIGSDTVVRVIMKDGQDIEALPPFVYWQNSICYRVVSV